MRQSFRPLPAMRCSRELSHRAHGFDEILNQTLRCYKFTRVFDLDGLTIIARKLCGVRGATKPPRSPTPGKSAARPYRPQAAPPDPPAPCAPSAARTRSPRPPAPTPPPVPPAAASAPPAATERESRT